MLTRRHFLATTATAGVLAGTGSVLAQSGGRDLSRTTLRVGIASALGPDVRLGAANLLKDTPYKIEWSTFPAAPPALEALNAGHIDVFSGGDTTALGLAANPGRAVVVAASTGTLFGALLVGKNSPIRTVAELKGKKVAVFRGAGFHYSVYQILRDAGVKWSEIEPVYLSPADALSALNSGAVDAWGIWDPNAAVAEVTYGARLLATPPRYSYGFQYASAKSLQSPELAAAISDHALRDFKAYNWINAHRDEWAKQQVAVAKIDPTVARLASSRTLPGAYLPIDDKLIGEMQDVADTFHEFGIIPKRVDIRPVFDARFNRELAARTAS